LTLGRRSFYSANVIHWLKKRAALWCFLGIALGMVATSWFRTASLSWSELRAGRVCEAQGDLPCAALRYRHALELHAPFFSASREGLAGLEKLGHKAAASGDVEGALVAYRSARVGILALRHTWQPFAEALPGLEDSIARLAVSPAQVEEHARQLRVARGALPSRAGVVGISLLLVGFLGFAGWGAASRAKPRRRAVLVGISVLCLIACLWLVQKA
jgi:hypothetical protein